LSSSLPHWASIFFESFASRSFSVDSFIREVLTNSYEADSPRVDVTISHNGAIFIEDWGFGMNESGIHGFWQIGRSTKKGTVSSRFHRMMASIVLLSSARGFPSLARGGRRGWMNSQSSSLIPLNFNGIRSDLTQSDRRTRRLSRLV
jgi:hypothetical protein